MRSAHISHDRGAICPFPPASRAASMALLAEGASVGVAEAPAITLLLSGGELWRASL